MGLYNNFKNIYRIELKDKIDSQNQNIKTTPPLLFKISCKWTLNNTPHRYKPQYIYILLNIKMENDTCGSSPGSSPELNASFYSSEKCTVFAKLVYFPFPCSQPKLFPLAIAHEITHNSQLFRIHNTLANQPLPLPPTTTITRRLHQRDTSTLGLVLRSLVDFNPFGFYLSSRYLMNSSQDPLTLYYEPHCVFNQNFLENDLVDIVIIMN